MFVLFGRAQDYNKCLLSLRLWQKLNCIIIGKLSSGIVASCTKNVVVKPAITLRIYIQEPICHLAYKKLWFKFLYIFWLDFLREQDEGSAQDYSNSIFWEIDIILFFYFNYIYT